MITNAETWAMVEDLPFFAGPPSDELTCAWAWLEKLQASGLTQIQIMQLKGPLENVHALGVSDGTDDVLEPVGGS